MWLALGKPWSSNNFGAPALAGLSTEDAKPVYTGGAIFDVARGASPSRQIWPRLSGRSLLFPPLFDRIIPRNLVDVTQ